MQNLNQIAERQIVDIGPIEGADIYLKAAINKAANIDQNGQAQNIRYVGIVGAGAMGRGIALALVNSGRKVTLLDVSETSISSAKNSTDRYFEAQYDKGRISKNTLVQRLSALNFTQQMTDLASVDMAIEAVPESMDLKKQVMASLEAITGPDTLLATNTSTLDIDEIASLVGSPERVIGTHFFIPAQVTKLLEVVPGLKTSPDTLASVMALAQDLGKTPVIAGNCDGFIGNRLFDRFHQEAMFLLEEGAYPEQVDQALEQWGYAIGPFRTLDIIGNEIPWSVRLERKKQLPEIVQPTVGDVLCECGHFGQKTGIGWYAYEANNRVSISSPKIHNLIEGVSETLGITRRIIDTEEIIERCVLSVVNEAAAILSGGYASRGSDIDVVQVNGYGFPANRGGPIYLADYLGLDQAIALVSSYKNIAGPGRALWEPHPFLKNLAESGESIAAWETKL